MTADLVSDEQLAEWEALADAATEGPWGAADEHGLIPGASPAWYVSRMEGDTWLDDLALIEGGFPEQWPHDAKFIAAARSAVPLLVRALRDARDELLTSVEGASAEIGELTAERDELRLHKSALLVANESLAAERDSLRAENEKLRATLNSSDAWFGAWECGCTDTERSVGAIPEFCPEHGARLISDDKGRTKVQLNHAGVSGYGVRPAALAAPTGQEAGNG